MRSPINASPPSSQMSPHDSAGSVARYTFTARDFHSRLFAGFAGALIMSFSDCVSRQRPFQLLSLLPGAQLDIHSTAAIQLGCVEAVKS
jgi:hypothetical protein